MFKKLVIIPVNSCWETQVTTVNLGLLKSESASALGLTFVMVRRTKHIKVYKEWME
jgi:hypothetical protein